MALRRMACERNIQTKLFQSRVPLKTGEMLCRRFTKQIDSLVAFFLFHCQTCVYFLVRPMSGQKSRSLAARMCHFHPFLLNPPLIIFASRTSQNTHGSRKKPKVEKTFGDAESQTDATYFSIAAWEVEKMTHDIYKLGPLFVLLHSNSLLLCVSPV